MGGSAGAVHGVADLVEPVLEEVAVGIYGRSERYHFGIMKCMAMTLRLTPEDERLLTALAQAEGVSRHEATLRAIREAASRHAHEADVAELSARARDRYADVLDRLGR